MDSGNRGADVLHSSAFWYGDCGVISILAILVALALGDAARVDRDAQGRTMPTQLRTIGWSTWTLMFVLLMLIVAMMYVAY